MNDPLAALDDIRRCHQVAFGRWAEAHRNEETLALFFEGPDGPMHEAMRSTMTRLNAWVADARASGVRVSEDAGHPRYRREAAHEGGGMVPDPNGQWVHVSDLGIAEWALDALDADQPEHSDGCHGGCGTNDSDNPPCPAQDALRSAPAAPQPDTALTPRDWTKVCERHHVLGLRGAVIGCADCRALGEGVES